MNTASLELCKELYELSRWDGTLAWYLDGEWGYVLDAKVDSRLDEFDHPAYDLGYLLRKLPHETSLYNWFQIGKHKNEYLVSWWYDADFIDEFEANTPEDAACKLAIELFRQGILTKEEV